jgi:hypothetical protein
LVYFVVILVHFSRLGMMYQEKSGNLALPEWNFAGKLGNAKKEM